MVDKALHIYKWMKYIYKDQRQRNGNDLHICMVDKALHIYKLAVESDFSKEAKAS
jgi:hypothetical protein